MDDDERNRQMIEKRLLELAKMVCTTSSLSLLTSLLLSPLLPVPALPFPQYHSDLMLQGIEPGNDDEIDEEGAEEAEPEFDPEKPHVAVKFSLRPGIKLEPYEPLPFFLFCF